MGLPPLRRRPWKGWPPGGKSGPPRPLSGSARRRVPREPPPCPDNLTCYVDGPGGNDGVLVFHDTNGDGDADQVILLIGQSTATFGSDDIV